MREDRGRRKTGMQVGLQVRWRSLLAALAGLLLPIPLVLAVGAGRVWPEHESMRQDIETVSPILTLDEQRSLLTYERSCQKRDDCEPPLGCVELFGGNALCMASECQTDLHCRDGFTCKVLRSRDEGPQVRLCVVHGLADEGAPCVSSFTFRREVLCREDLLCNDGYCGRPCRPGPPGSCPTGFFCASSREGASCLPNCEGQACAQQGQQCVRFERERSMCARVQGANCQQQPCPEGTACNVSYNPERPGEVSMECKAP